MNLCVVDWIRIGSWKKLCRESHWNITEDLTSSLGVIPRCAPSTTDHNSMLACCGPWVKACVWSYPQEMLVHSQSYSNGLLGYNRIVISCECVRACVHVCASVRVCVYVHVRASSGLCWPSTPLRFMHDPTPHHLNLVNSSSNSCFIHVLIYIFVYWYLVNDRSACIHVCNLTKIWTENSTMGGYWGNLCKLNIQVKLKNYWPMGDLECILYPQKWLSGLISMVLIEKIP